MGMLIKTKLNRTSWFSKTGLALLLSLSATVLMTDSKAFAVGGVITDCGGCHGYTAASSNPIADGASRNDAGKFQGSHAPHVITQATACSVCHTQPASNAHANGTVNINGAGTISGGTYGKASFAVSNGAFSPSNCSNVTCHEPYLAGTTTTPNWGTAATCDACHKGSGALATTGPATGSHVAHNNTNCALCHTGATNSTTLPSANHMNNNINVANGYPATVTKHTINTGYTGTCSAASCHANPYLVGGTVTSPVWGTASGCEACHTVASGGSIASTGPATGSHVAHNNTACNNCHANITTFAAAPTANHPDANINVTNGYPATVTKHTINTGFTSCSAASCHAPYSASGSTPVWGQIAGCEACHANNATTNSNAGAFTPYSTTAAHATTATGPRTGSHTSHLNWGKTVCTDCHNAGTTSTTVPSTAHADGDIDVTNGYTANVPKHTVASGYGGRTCSTNCHNPGNAHAWGTLLGCTDCHHVAITRKKGRPGKTLSPVTGEFGLAWGHKKSGRGAVTSQDCIVCHLEGKWTTNYTAWSTSEYHADGNIDLRNPDGVGEVKITNIAGAAWTFQRFSTSYAAGTRTTTGHTAEKIDNIITQKFCLACHDSNGATNTTARNGATGTATMPWSGVNLGATYTTANGAAAAGGVINVKSQTLTTNASFHPVQGPRYAGYPATSLMVAPYNGTRTAGTLANSYVMTCFDCHNQTGTLLTTRTSASHGNAVSLRAAFNFPTSAANMTVTNGQALCRVCHNPNATSGATGHYTGSAFGFSTGRTEKNAPLAYGCNSCHSSGIDNATSAARPVRAQDVHGYPSTVSGSATYKKAFIRGTIIGTNTNTQLQNYVPQKIGATTYSSTCTGMGGTICAGSRTRTNTPGGIY